ncbi:hypothetical protein [Alkalicoccus luteus]|uniref:Uncharacterized protein n=1 Tax=Alkalicoccus luteus TaxID=1237094 RepID=A0A969PWB4_9BACI|nr:hypothetical protein [Alkalicoccus luteus]NJP36827.1 hypothetical protein [Alkalicoccus luteus]
MSDRIKTLRKKQLLFMNALLVAIIVTYIALSAAGLPGISILLFAAAALFIFQAFRLFRGKSAVPIPFLEELDRHEQEASPVRSARNRYSQKIFSVVLPLLLLFQAFTQLEQTSFSWWVAGGFLLIAPILNLATFLQVKQYDEGAGGEVPGLMIVFYILGSVGITGAVLMGAYLIQLY